MAEATQEDVFKSISNNMDSQVDGGKVFAVLAAAGGVVGILLWISKREKREVAPRTLNHQGRLMRELIKTAGLKPTEARQLKTIADQLAERGQPLESPITLMLCPSLMSKSQGK